MLLSPISTKSAGNSNQRTRSPGRFRWLLTIVMIGVFATTVCLEVTQLIKKKAHRQSGSLSQSELTSGSQTRRQRRSERQEAPWSAFQQPIIKDGVAWLHDYQGALFISRHGNEKWIPIAGDASKQFSQFTMLDFYRGWATDDNGQIWKTDDSGYNWYPISFVRPKDADEFYNGASQIFFSDSNNGWLVDAFNVWKTSDGGFLWNEIKELNRPTSPIRQIQMVNAHVGWAICAGDLLRTEDGGNNWRSIRKDTGLDRFTTITTFSFTDINHAWLAATNAPEPYPENVVLYTENGGVTWRKANGLDDRSAVYAFCFLDDKLGWAAGGATGDFESYFGKGLLFQTNDGGVTWYNVSTAPSTDTLKTVYFTSMEEGWLASNYDVYRTHDGGRTWSSLISYPEIRTRNLQVYQGTQKSTSNNLITQK